MDSLRDLLKRVERSLGRDVAEREAVASAIKEVLKFDIRLEDVSIKNDCIHIKTSPVKKNAIKLEEAKVLLLAREKTGLNLTRVLYL